MGETLDKAASTAAEAILKLATSLSELVSKMTDLLYRGGLGLGRLGEKAIEGAETIYLKYTKVDAPPPYDFKASQFFLNGHYYAFLHYNERMYRKDLAKEEPGLLTLKTRLDDLKAEKDATRGDMSLLTVVDEDIREDLAKAENKRDKHRPGTKEYIRLNTDVESLKGKMDTVQLKHSDKYKLLHKKNYEQDANTYFSDLGVALSLEQTISLLEERYKQKSKNVNKLRERYEWSSDAKAQYKERKNDEILRLNKEIAEIEQDCPKKWLGTTPNCGSAQGQAIEVLQKQLAENVATQNGFPGEEKEAEDAIADSEIIMPTEQKKDSKAEADNIREEKL